MFDLLKPYWSIFYQKTTKVCCFQYVLVDIDNFTAGWRSKDSLIHLYIENFHSKNLVSICDSAIAKIYFEIFLKIELKFEFQNSKKWNGMIEIVFESREKWKFNTNNENKVLIWMFLWLEKRARLVSYQGSMDRQDLRTRTEPLGPGPTCVWSWKLGLSLKFMIHWNFHDQYETWKDSIQENDGLVDSYVSFDHFRNCAGIIGQHESQTSWGLFNFILNSYKSFSS